MYTGSTNIAHGLSAGLVAILVECENTDANRVDDLCEAEENALDRCGEE